MHFSLIEPRADLDVGSALQGVPTHQRAVRAVNAAMALALVASLWPIFADAWR